MANYKLRLSKLAENDLRELYRHGLLNWGEQQADLYYDHLLETFDLICENPRLYRAVDEIREGYRRGISGAHAIYYRVTETEVEIMAILKHQDITTRF